MTTRVVIRTETDPGYVHRFVEEIDCLAPERATAAALRLAAQAIDPDTRCLKCGKTKALHRNHPGGPFGGSAAYRCADGESIFDPEPVR